MYIMIDEYSDDEINIKKLRPYKRLGTGSEGVIILSNNNKYTVKIYRLNPLYMKSYIKLINYIQKYNIPTIYKSYKLLPMKNSLNRYENKLPNYFSYLDEENLIKLLKKYNMKTRLIDIMKTYKITLNGFIQNLLRNYLINNSINKNKILKSFYKQAILTLYWLYMKKGIVHKDLSLDNFFVEKTKDKILEINIGHNTYKIKLYGYYLVICDFGHARSFELFDAKDYPNNLSISFGSFDMNPYYEILTIINIFKKYIKLDLDEYMLRLGMFNPSYGMDINNNYKIVMKSYMKSNDNKDNMKKFREELKKFKKNYSDFIINKILQA